MMLSLPSLPMKQIPLDLGPSAAFVREDFVEGNNPALTSWLLNWPNDLAQEPVVVYLWGALGVGKTHLLRALASVAHGLGWQVLLLDSQGLQSMDADHPEAPTLVLLDDCERMDDTCQHWAFNMFIEAAASAQSSHPVRIIAAGVCPPVDLPVREDLRTRLGWGLVFGMEPLPEEGVRRVLIRESQRRGLNWAEGVLPYILTRFNRNLGELMPLVDRLDRFALAEKRVITVPLLKQMLEQEQAAS